MQVHIYNDALLDVHTFLFINQENKGVLSVGANSITIQRGDQLQVKRIIEEKTVAKSAVYTVEDVTNLVINNNVYYVALRIIFEYVIPIIFLFTAIEVFNLLQTTDYINIVYFILMTLFYLLTYLILKKYIINRFVNQYQIAPIYGRRES